MPEPDTFAVLPWTQNGAKVARVWCICFRNREERDEPGEAAVRIGRRMIELLQKRTADGYVARVDLRLRPSPEATPIALPVNAAISYYESAALGWEVQDVPEGFRLIPRA